MSENMIDNPVTYFAMTNYRNQMKKFGIKKIDRQRHMYILGKTGSGKTTLLANIALQDIERGEGLAIIDPHGDVLNEILEFIPSHRVNDVIYINPADVEHPIAFNVLENVNEDQKHLVASGLMSVFKKIWANMWSARMEYILNNTILALLDSPGNTLMGIMRMFSDKNYRKKIVDNVKDPVVKSFWTAEFASYNDRFRQEAIAPIQNKVGQFLSSAVIRNIVGQPKSTIDLRQAMDGGKIMLIDLSKGKIGEDNSSLLGAMLITKLWLAAMSRVDTVEKERKDFYLYVDEFQNFVNDTFADILSEARKYHLNLIIAHQYIAQLNSLDSTKVKDAVFGNVGTMACFRVGAGDAEELIKEFEPYFTEENLVNIGKYEIFLKLMINSMISKPFTAKTLPPFSLGKRNDNKDTIIKVSRERYANDRLKVEEDLMRWSGVEKTFSEVGRTESVSGEHVMYKEKTAETDLSKKKYDVLCDSCSVQTAINFEPKKGKPILCKDCLKEYQRGKIKDGQLVSKNKELIDKIELKKNSSVTEKKETEFKKKESVPAGASKETFEKDKDEKKESVPVEVPKEKKKVFEDTKKDDTFKKFEKVKPSVKISLVNEENDSVPEKKDEKVVGLEALQKDQNLSSFKKEKNKSVRPGQIIKFD
jgi:CxxC-x17-CxxC domain-containing protein